MKKYAIDIHLIDDPSFQSWDINAMIEQDDECLGDDEDCLEGSGGFGENHQVSKAPPRPHFSNPSLH